MSSNGPDWRMWSMFANSPYRHPYVYPVIMPVCDPNHCHQCHQRNHNFHTTGNRLIDETSQDLMSLSNQLSDDQISNEPNTDSKETQAVDTKADQFYHLMDKIKGFFPNKSEEELSEVIVSSSRLLILFTEKEGFNGFSEVVDAFEQYMKVEDKTNDEMDAIPQPISELADEMDNEVDNEVDLNIELVTDLTTECTEVTTELATDSNAEYIANLTDMLSTKFSPKKAAELDFEYKPECITESIAEYIPEKSAFTDFSTDQTSNEQKIEEMPEISGESVVSPKATQPEKYHKLLTKLRFLHQNLSDEKLVEVIETTRDQLIKSGLKGFSGMKITEIVNKVSDSIKNDERCGICANPITTIESRIGLSCQHIFHYGCLEEWAQMNNHCPECGKGF